MAVTKLPPSAGPRSDVGSVTRHRVLFSEGAGLVVVLRGEIDVAAQPFLCRVMSGVIAFGVGDVVVDLAHVTFVDTASVRVLATAQHLLDGDGRRLTIRSPSRLALRVLDMFGLSSLVETTPPVQRLEPAS
jgi:anti-sigma B factor antagonist